MLIEGTWCGSSFIIPHVIPSLPSTTYWRGYFYLMYVSGIFAQSHMTAACGFILALLVHRLICPFLCQSQLLCHHAPVLEFEIRCWLWYLQRFLLRNVLDIWHSLCSIWILVIFFSFCKDCHWNFDGGTIKCIISFPNYILFIIFILPIHEHKSTFCFL